MQINFGISQLLGVENGAQFQCLIKIRYFANRVFRSCNLYKFLYPLEVNLTLMFLKKSNQLFLGHWEGKVSKEQNDPIFLFTIFLGFILEYSKDFTIFSKFLTIGLESGETVIHKGSTISIGELQYDWWFSFVVDFFGSLKLEPRITLSEFFLDGIFYFQYCLFFIDFSGYIMQQ